MALPTRTGTYVSPIRPCPDPLTTTYTSSCPDAVSWCSMPASPGGRSPFAFDASSSTRIVEPTVAAPTGYDDPVAFGISERLAPFASCHRSDAQLRGARGAARGPPVPATRRGRTPRAPRSMTQRQPYGRPGVDNAPGQFLDDERPTYDDDARSPLVKVVDASCRTSRRENPSRLRRSS